MKRPGERRLEIVLAGPGLAPTWAEGLAWLALLGHEAVVFEARPKAGGLNEYGLAAYKTVDDYAQHEIDWLLSIGGIIGLIGQMPGGAIVDAARSERLVAGLAVATIGICALGYAVWPIFPVVMAAATLHALASCVLGPAIAAISLGLVGPQAIGDRVQSA